MIAMKYEKAGCVEKSGVSLLPVLCVECSFGDDEDACGAEEREYYIYKKVE